MAGGRVGGMRNGSLCWKHGNDVLAAEPTGAAVVDFDLATAGMHGVQQTDGTDFCTLQDRVSQGWIH